MFETLDEQEIELIRRCIIAVKTRIDGGYHARIGIGKSEADAILQRWPFVAGVSAISDQELSDMELLSYNSLNDALYGVGLSENEISEEIGSSSIEMAEILERLRRDVGSPNQPH